MTPSIFRGRRVRRFWKLAVVASALVVLAVVFVAGSSANLVGSSFEGNDGNLIVNTPGNTDWANAPSLVTGIDQPSGTSDNAFGQGTKEDNPNVTIVTGSIPPNKNDLTRFYISSEFSGGSNFLYLGWERAVNIGNANLDLEINQHATAGFTGTSTGSLALNRTAGDLLVTYDFSGSGTPTLGLLTWLTSGPNSQCFASNGTVPCWGNHVDLTGAGFAQGAVNAVNVTDPISGQALTAGLFGEAAINLTAAGVFPAGTCAAFGSTFLKSRSSSAFGSEVKDFIAPQALNISNCGMVRIIKNTDPRNIDQDFSYTSTIPNPATGSNSPTCTADSTPSSFTLNDGSGKVNTEECSFVVAGNYTVTEGAEPANFTLESLTCTATNGGSGVQDAANPAQADLTVVPDSIITCTYVNKQLLGAIKISKTSSKAAATPLGGATFSISGPNGYSSTQTTGSDGTVCVDHLAFGAYSVQETAAPSGYAIDDSTAHSVTVGQTSMCGDGHEAAFSATDTPLTDLTITVTSEVAGGTQSTITCTNDASSGGIGNSPQGPAGTVNVAANGLKPGNYTCKVNVDP
jgi:hypothetical protein